MAESKLWVELTERELETLAALQEEMGLRSTDEVMHALIRQAQTRAIIVCPACGHSAQPTAQDEARCNACMSVLHLSDEVWTIATSRVEHQQS